MLDQESDADGCEPVGPRPGGLGIGDAFHYQPELDETPETREASRIEREKMLTEAVTELEALVGMEPVKRSVRVLLARLRIAVARREHDLPVSMRPHHLVFAGPPGTGKTTVARIIGKVFAGTGVLPRGHVVEAQRSDLVGEYVGATAIKTGKLVDRALGGVLFIDEAYSLQGDYGHEADTFGDEALQILLKRAEDDRDRLVIVLAGYRDDMRRLLAANAGLASRFATRIDFPSFTAEELWTVADGIFAGAGDVLYGRAPAQLRRCCDTVERHGWADELGNGRFVRTLCEHTQANRDLRVCEELGVGDPTRQQLVRILAADIEVAFDELCTGHGLTGRLRAAG